MKKYVTDWSEVPVLVDIPYVAVLFGIHPHTVERKLRAGELKGIKIGREWRITKQALLEYIGLDEKCITSESLIQNSYTK